MPPYLLAVAIQFGSTHTGCAMSWRSQFTTDPTRMSVMHWNDHNNDLKEKTLSCILFEPNGCFDSFGFDARYCYTNLKDSGKHGDYFFIEGFSELLYKKLACEASLKDTSGRKIPALKVLSESIRYLKTRLMQKLTEQRVIIDEKDVRWVIIVPAPINDVGRHFIREAANAAGIESSQLYLILEPEAATIYCKHQVNISKGFETQDSTVKESSWFQPGRKHMVLDAGRVTTRCTIFETLESNQMRLTYIGKSIPWGDNSINDEFIQCLSDVFGRGVMEEFMREHVEDYLVLMEDFEIKKRSDSQSMQGVERIRVPRSLLELLKSQSDTANIRETDEVKLKGERLRMSSSLFKSFFSKTCDQIVNEVFGMFSRPSVKGTETILMIGKLSNSAMLQNAVKQAFPDLNIIMPEEADFAALRGGVIFGHEPSSASYRVYKYTYGMKTSKPFDPVKDPHSKKVLVDGQYLCSNIFEKHLELGQPTVTEITIEKRYPLHHDQKKLIVEYYSSSFENPKFTDESGCSCVATFEVDLSSVSECEDKEVLLKMIISGTELQVEARLSDTGEILLLDTFVLLYY